MTKTPEELFKERNKRIEDAISLRVPDRVPIWFLDTGFFPARNAGITCKDFMYDDDILFSAARKAYLEFEPDMYFNPGMVMPTPGKAVEEMDCKQIVLPGQNRVPVDQSFQFVEKEYMTAAEYDEFLDDPTAFTIYKYLPRVFGKLAPLSTMPPITGMLLGYYGMPLFAGIANEAVIDAMETFCRTARAVQKRAEGAAAFNADMKQNGIPLGLGGLTEAPYDLIGDFLRGLHGMVMDMFRAPDKLLAAIEKVTPLMINLAVAQSQASGCSRIFIPLHKGSNGFMSQLQFEKFYWPSLKQLLLALIDKGITPCPFFEGDHSQRLETYTELPKGKVLGLFDATDFHKAKEVLGDTMCMCGFMPLSILKTGTPDDVKAYAKELIDVVGKNGGFIMGPKTCMDDAKPELVKVWFEFTKEYGRYR